VVAAKGPLVGARTTTLSLRRNHLALRAWKSRSRRSWRVFNVRKALCVLLLTDVKTTSDRYSFFTRQMVETALAVAVAGK
jgi:hypothetical protein